MSRNHMYTEMIIKSDEACRKLMRADDNDANALYLKCLAVIIVSNFRMFIREKSEIEIYQTLKEIPALTKIRANEKHRIAGYIKEFL